MVREYIVYHGNMKKLYLVRHAKSSKDIPGIEDKQRPLNRRGQRECRYIGKRLEKRGIVAQAFYSSPAKRALDTARAIARETGFPPGEIKTVNSLYASSIPKLMKVIKNIDDTVESAMMCGHNPEFLGLINYLATRPIKEFPPCGVFGISFNIDSWKRTGRKKGRLAFFDCPGENRNGSRPRVQGTTATL